MRTARHTPHCLVRTRTHGTLFPKYHTSPYVLGSITDVFSKFMLAPITLSGVWPVEIVRGGPDRTPSRTARQAGPEDLQANDAELGELGPSYHPQLLYFERTQGISRLVTLYRDSRLVDEIAGVRRASSKRPSCLSVRLSLRGSEF